MKQSRLAQSFISAAGLAALLALSPANAVPCGTYATVGGVKIGSTDLGASSATCRNGAANDANNSLGDLNDGAFFGSTDWVDLDKADEGEFGNASYWTFSGPSKPSGAIDGTFSLAAGIWDHFSKLVVVLKDGGSTTNKSIKWSAYLLPFDVYGTYNWSYDNRKELSHASIYGVIGERTVTVPEPAALATLAFGLAGAAVTLRRKRVR